MKLKLPTLLLSLTFLSCGWVTATSVAIGSQEFERFDTILPTYIPANSFPVASPQKDDKKAKKDSSPITDTSAQKSAKLPDNKMIRFHMWDGTVITGEVEVDQISMITEFGVLQIPIQRIQKMSPGLESFPELESEIRKHIENLGNKKIAIREAAQKALTNMGSQIRNVLNETDAGNDAERKKRLAAIQKEFDEAEEDEDFQSSESALIRGDTLVTPEFAIVGKIKQQQFLVQSKFGKLTVQLGDIKMADRPVKTTPQEVRKTVSVGAEAFFQRSPVSTRIRVSKGDKISIKAEGMVNWTNWSQTSTPEGLSNQQKYNGINSGALCARIGSSGKVIKIGAKEDFVASKSGVLYLAIAMNDNLVNQSYRWTGNFKAKVYVKPTEE
ncbi:MAG: hypothetical protein AB8B55_04980 [Mariniblastus sp.]